MRLHAIFKKKKKKRSLSNCKLSYRLVNFFMNSYMSLIKILDIFSLGGNIRISIFLNFRIYHSPPLKNKIDDESPTLEGHSTPLSKDLKADKII